MDPIRLRDGDALAAVIARHPHVVAILVGHAHTMAATTFAGRPLLIGGGVVSTVTADAEAPPTLWYDAPPSLRPPPRRRRRARHHPLAGAAPGVSNLGTVLLAFDTATPYVTVALHDGERRRRRAALGASG